MSPQGHPKPSTLRKRTLARRKEQIEAELGKICSYRSPNPNSPRPCQAYRTQIGFYRLPIHPELFTFDEYALDPDLVPREILADPQYDEELDPNFNPDPRRYWRLTKSWGVSQKRFEAELRRCAALCVYHWKAIQAVSIPRPPTNIEEELSHPTEFRPEPIPPILAFARIDPDLNKHAAPTLAAQRKLLDSIGAPYRV